MILTKTSAEALKGRRIVKSQGTGIEHWTTDFFGRRATEVLDEPQTMLIEMRDDETIVSHFHAVDQFQVFVAGSGSLGRHAAGPLTLQYVDHHTGYGPIVAGPQGLSYFVFRAQTDSGTVYLDRPGYREKLKPSKKRNRLGPTVYISTAPVLQSRKEIAREPLFNEDDCKDGLGAQALRMGPDQVTDGPDPSGTQGQYVLVINGSLEHDGMSYPEWSTIFVGGDERPFQLRSGARGVEALLMQFPPADH